MACTSSKGGATPRPPGSSGGSGKYGYKIAVVTHGGAGDTFWDVVKKGALQAGKDEGDNVTYQSDGDPAKQSQLIDAAVQQKVDGLVVSMANPDALKASIEKAVAAGIPGHHDQLRPGQVRGVRSDRARRPGRDDRG